jgi:hypothetical protein
MALSGVIKNFRDGRETITEGSGISFEIAYEPGDFSMENLAESGFNVTDYKDRGVFQTLRKTDQLYPTFSVTAHMTAFLGAVGAGNRSLLDAIMRLGGFAGGQSTLGAASGLPYTFDFAYQVEGSDLGDAGDYTVTLSDCHAILSFKEGDPNSFTLAGTCYGGAVFT